ncbi:hypothetical protein Pvag_pPag20117 (plasmid) [Pantoea vagans C9-1]|nr:hypothetical protein Pvag_pPag20117 [Pantoea vagans C9-1]
MSLLIFFSELFTISRFFYFIVETHFFIIPASIPPE